MNKRIVAIHDVAEDTLAPKRLKRYIRWVQRLGYKFVPMDHILSDKSSGKLVTLTIDDAYSSSIDTLLPILEEFGITSMLFVPTGLLGKKANDPELLSNDCYANKSTMTWEQLHQWVEKGQRIGFHTHKHLDLFHHNNKEIEIDFQEGIAALRDNGFHTEYFAYPKGFLPADRAYFEGLLRQGGMKYAFTVNYGEANPEDGYYINRAIIGNSEPLFWSLCKTIGVADRFFYKYRQYQEQKI